MTRGQEVYKTTPAVDFALNWKTFQPELREELILIHAIQTNLLKHWHFQTCKPEEFNHEFDLQIRENHEKMISEYKEKYGDYKLANIYFDEEIKSGQIKLFGR